MSLRARLLLLSVTATLLGVLAVTSVPSDAQTPIGPPVLCTAVNVTTATLVAFTGTGCAGNPTQTSLYITDIVASSSTISSITADNYLELKAGTGTNCATGTVVLWAAYTLALTPVVQSFRTPIKVPGGFDLCWMDAVAGSKSLIVTGYLAAP